MPNKDAPEKTTAFFDDMNLVDVEPPVTLEESIRIYVAALSESGDNFMKPENVSEELREEYVQSLTRLFKAHLRQFKQKAIKALPLKINARPGSTNRFAAGWDEALEQSADVLKRLT